MNVLVLSKDDLLKVADSSTLVDSAKEAFSSYSTGKVTQPERQVEVVNGNWWGSMIGFNEQSFGIKIVNVINENKKRGKASVNGVAILFSSETGEPECIAEGSTLTALRTAAASVLSTWLALGKKSFNSLGIIGAGEEAYYHVKIAKDFFSIGSIMIHARSSHVRMAKELDLIATDLKELLSSSEVIFSTTSSHEPVVLGKFLRPDFHVSSIGAHTPGSRELDDDVISKAKTIIVDSKEAVSKESGDIVIPSSLGMLGDKVIEIGEVISKGIKIERPSVFKTVGIASQDLMAMSYLCKKAEREGIGREVEM